MTLYDPENSSTAEARTPMPPSAASTIKVSDIESFETRQPKEKSAKDTKSTPPPDFGNIQVDRPETDRGWRAWMFLVGAFIVEAICSGFPSSYGVFMDYYGSHPPFEGKGSLSIVGPMSNGILMTLNPILIYFIAKYPRYRKLMMWMGLTFCSSGCIGGAFAQTVPQLIITQGALYGIGSGMLFVPTLSYLTEWFVKRRAFAYGIMFAGNGASGAFLPFIFSSLLSHFGHRTTLVAWGIAVAILTGISLFLIRGRLQLSELPPPQKIQLQFLKSPVFCILFLSTFFQGLVHYLPGVFMPTYATDMGLSQVKGALLLCIVNIAYTVGQPPLGWLSDKIGIYVPTILSTVIGGLSILFLWGFGHSFGLLVALVIVYGIFSGGYAAFRSRFVTVILGEDDKQPEQALTAFGVLTFARGVATVISGPVSQSLLPERKEGDRITSGYGGGRWLRLIVFIGTLQLISGLGACVFFLKRGRDGARN